MIRAMGEGGDVSAYLLVLLSFGVVGSPCDFGRAM